MYKKLNTSLLYITGFYFLTIGILFLQPKPLFMGIGNSFIDYLLSPVSHLIKNQFIRSAHSRVVFFIWTMSVHFFWIKKVDPTYRLPVFYHIIQFTNYIKGIVSSVLLMTISQLVFLFIINLPYTVEIQYEKLFINLPIVALLSFFTSAGEEIIFRQYTLKKLEAFGLHKAVIVQALLFGLIHYNSQAGWGRVCSTALAGLFFGYSRVYTNSLAYCIGLHSGMHLTNLKTYIGPFFNLNVYKSVIFIVDDNFGGLIGQIPLLLSIIYMGFLVSKNKKNQGDQIIV